MVSETSPQPLLSDIRELQKYWGLLCTKYNCTAAKGQVLRVAQVEELHRELCCCTEVALRGGDGAS